jgi:hypothetical protein
MSDLDAAGATKMASLLGEFEVSVMTANVPTSQTSPATSPQSPTTTPRSFAETSPTSSTAFTELPDVNSLLDGPLIQSTSTQLLIPTTSQATGGEAFIGYALDRFGILGLCPSPILRRYHKFSRYLY